LTAGASDASAAASQPGLGLIVAVAENGVIGVKGELPWRLPDDLKHFKRTTLGHCLLMGRKTWESLPGALPGRTSIVMSRQPGYQADGAIVVKDLEAAIKTAREHGDLSPIVAGGAAVYAAALPATGVMWLTRVQASPEGDVSFPEWDVRDWALEERSFHSADARHPHAFAIETWRRHGS